MGVSSSFSKMAAVISPFVSAMMLDLPLVVSLIMFAIFFLSAAISAVFLPLETKNRKLKDITL